MTTSSVACSYTTPRDATRPSNRAPQRLVHAVEEAASEKSPERVAQPNGYREPGWRTRTGTVELRIPKSRTGS